MGRNRRVDGHWLRGCRGINMHRRGDNRCVGLQLGGRKAWYDGTRLMEAADGKVSKEGGHSLLRDAKLCEDVGTVLAHDA